MKNADQQKRVRFTLNGIVQGVGFRPFVYNLAKQLALNGTVSNDSSGVIIEIQGTFAAIELFQSKLLTENPPISKITSCRTEDVALNDEVDFRIIASHQHSQPTTLISPDLATCDDCLKELVNPKDRRYSYPFINCTNCGPRYTIVEGIPYDRPLTSMAKFKMCLQCQAEYDNPSDRRFHAQPNACPVCGPQIYLHDGQNIIPADDPIAKTLNAISEGKIVAIRGVGGFHLAVDPNNESAVEKLRLRKGRAEKPFALMAKDISTIKKYCIVSEIEEQLLADFKRPIVLLEKKTGIKLNNNIAPGSNHLGFMLPYTPLHHLLLAGEFDLLIMTSGNFSEEPIAIGNNEALERLENIADLFLLHDREILQRCDDSIVMALNGLPQTIRRSRGFVPYPVFVENKLTHRVLAVGGELKNSIALNRGDTVFLSQYIGDLDNPSAYKFFVNSIEHLKKILEIEPTLIAHDLHPEYLSTKYAKSTDLPKIAIQHHHAHFVSVMTENNHRDKTIGLILDGTGYGTDGTIWGGEVLIGDATSFERFMHLETVPLPGGASAIKQPWRMALSYLYKTYGDDFHQLDLPFLKQIKDSDLSLIIQMIDKKLNSPITSSCGRFFDAVSALLNLKAEINYDAQAAIFLEQEAQRYGSYPAPLQLNLSYEKVIKTTMLFKELVNLLLDNEPIPKIAALFHVTLAEMFIASAQKARDFYKIDTVALSGGVYMNRYFTKYMLDRLREEKFNILTHKELPANDGGLALGQTMIANAQFNQ